MSGGRIVIALVAERAAELERVCLRHHVRRLELFGSAASGQFDPARSDLDFLVEFQPAAFDGYANTYFGLLEALEQLFQRPVDLVVRSAIKNPYFLQAVEDTRAAVHEA